MTLEFNKVVVKFGELPHCMFYRDQLAGFTSWRYGDKNYAIQYTFVGGAEITCEYDDGVKWKTILAGLMEVL